MNFNEAKNLYLDELKETYNCLTLEELIARLGKTTIRCGWVDYCDLLSRNKEITEHQRMNWGQIL